MPSPGYARIRSRLRLPCAMCLASPSRALIRIMGILEVVRMTKSLIPRGQALRGEQVGSKSELCTGAEPVSVVDSSLDVTDLGIRLLGFR